MNKIALITLAIAFVIAMPMFSRVPTAHSITTAALGILPASRVTSSIANGNFNVTLHIDNVSSLWSWKVNVTWDPSILNLTSGPTEGPFLQSAGSTWFIAAPTKPGQIPEVSCSFLSTTGVNGSGDLAYLTFRAINASNYTYTSGGTLVNITSIIMLDPAYNNIAYTSTNCIVHVAIPGDITGGTHPTDFVPDGKVDGKDIATVALNFGQLDNLRNANCDVNNDGKIDGKDIALIALHFGQAA